KIAGLKFFKLLGAGKGQGFSILPDWGRYALLAVWESETAKTAFFGRHPLYEQYQSRAYETWTVTLSVMSAHGLWSKVNPFEETDDEVAPNQPVAILTR